MTASGSLATLGVAELLQMAALFRKRGALRLYFPTGRRIVVYVHDGNLGGLTDTARRWHLGDLLASSGRLDDEDRKRLLIDARLRGKRLGQLLVEEGHLSRDDLEGLLRRLILHSLLYAVENENQGEFELEVGQVHDTSVTFPIADFLIEISSCIDEFQRLRGELGAGSGAIALEPGLDLAGALHTLSYRQVQVLAQVDGCKTPMQIAGVVDLSPTETLALLADLAAKGVIVWATWAGSRLVRPLAEVVRLRRPSPLPHRGALP